MLNTTIRRANSLRTAFTLAAVAIAALVTAPAFAQASPSSPETRDRYVLGLIAKSLTNPVFIAAQRGAEDAQREILNDKGIAIEIVWRAPAKDDASRQVQILEEMIAQGVDGIAISCSDPALVTPAINRAVAAGVQVVTFDSDAPDSDRIGYYGIDDYAAGEMIMAELVKLMPDGGRVAILSGNRAAENIRNRVLGVASQANRQDNFQLVGAFDHDETPLGAGAAMTKAHDYYGPIDGWVLVGGWPLYHANGLEGVPEGTPIVSIDVLPQTIEALDSGRVQALLGQPYFNWGHESVMMLFNRLHEGTSPEPAVQTTTLEIVKKDASDKYRDRWVEWIGAAAVADMTIQVADEDNTN